MACSTTKTDMAEIPDDWLVYLADARRIFGVAGEEWRFLVQMSDKPGCSRDNGGAVSVDSVYKNVNIELNTDVDDARRRREYAYHETLHVPHQAIDHLVTQILEHVPKGMRDMFDDLYQDEVERFVQSVSRSVVAMLYEDEGEKKDES